LKFFDKIENENIIKNLTIRTKKPVDEIVKLIADEWWLTSDEAINNLGFVGTSTLAIENTAKTSRKTYTRIILKKKKALNSNAFKQFINFKNSLR
jgi:hypothetical protein